MKIFYKLAFFLIRLYWKLAKPITVGVRLLMIQEERVFLVKHTYDGGWHMPGGGMKRDETLEEAVRREAAEETGAVLHDLRLFGAYSGFYQGKSDHVVVFVATDFTLTGPVDRGEIEQASFFPLQSLPAVASVGTKQRVAEYLQNCPPYYGSW